MPRRSLLTPLSRGLGARDRRFTFPGPVDAPDEVDPFTQVPAPVPLNMAVPDPTLVGGFTNDLSLNLGGTDEYVRSDANVSALTGGTFTSTMSIALWMRWSGTPVIFDSIAGFTTSFSWNDGGGIFWNSASEIRGWVRQFNVGVASHTSVTPGIWHHLVLVFDQNEGAGNRVKLYLDNVVANGAGQNLALNGLANPFQVGRLGTTGVSTGSHATGDFDEVAFWDVALSASEVSTLYNGGIPAPSNAVQSANLVIWYRMGDDPSDDEQAAAGFRDQSGNANHGTGQNLEIGDFTNATPP